MPSVLNNREWALLIWLAVGLGVALAFRGGRSSIVALSRAFLKLKILVPVGLMAAWVSGLVMAARSLSAWTTALIGPTVLWFGGVALILLMRSTGVSEEAGFLRKVFVQAVGVAALVEGFTNLYVFPLWFELFLLPILLSVGVLVALADAKDEFATWRTPLRWTLAFIGIGILIYVIAHVASDVVGAHLGSHLPMRHGRADIAAHRAGLKNDARSLAMPVWLTVGLLPFIYFVGLMAAYEVAFLVINFSSEDGSAKRRAKIALVLSVNVHAHLLGEFRAPWPYRLVNEPDLKAARRTARRFTADPGS